MPKKGNLPTAAAEVVSALNPPTNQPLYPPIVEKPAPESQKKSLDGSAYLVPFDNERLKFKPPPETGTKSAMSI